MAAAMRVLICDDSFLVRRGFRSWFQNTTPSIEIVAEATNGVEAIDLFLEHRPEMILMDVRMPNMDGISAAKHILKIEPSTKIIILSFSQFGRDMSLAAKAGVSAFLSHEEMNGPKLHQIMLRVLNGEKLYYPPFSTNQREMANAGLTPQEQDVAFLLAERLSTQEIADKLGIAINMVQNTVVKLYSLVPEKPSLPGSDGPFGDLNSLN